MKTNVFILFILILASIGYLLVYFQLRIRKKRLITEEKEIKRKHTQEEERIKKLNHQSAHEKETLMSQINDKNKELATAVMHLIQKSELIDKIREEIIITIKENIESKPVNQLKKILRLINEDHKFDEDWEQFAVHFDSVHEEFLQKVKSKFPGITRNELKLCSYIKMNLSTKEIAPLMNISVRGVEVSRYRLRKKLHIPSEADLYTFLIDSIKEEKDFDGIRTTIKKGAIIAPF